MLVKPATARGINGGLRAAGNDGVGIAVADGVKRLAHGVGGGGAGGDHRAGTGPCAP